MLEVKKSYKLEGNSTIDGKIAENYSASIDSNNPDNMNIYSSQVDRAAYKTNREQCRKDRTEFEEMAYKLQDTMLAEKNKGEQ